MTLMHTPDCRAWELTEQRLNRALVRLRLDDVRVNVTVVEGSPAAIDKGLLGTPTILVDGKDPFIELPAAVGLHQRTFRTPIGMALAPTCDQLFGAIREASIREAEARVIRLPDVPVGVPVS